MSKAKNSAPPKGAEKLKAPSKSSTGTNTSAEFTLTSRKPHSIFTK